MAHGSLQDMYLITSYFLPLMEGQLQLHFNPTSPIHAIPEPEEMRAGSNIRYSTRVSDLAALAALAALEIIVSL